MKIHKITIENFRGIKIPLVLDFKKGKNHTSVALYGRNGNGKSSIVDAWEWLYSNKIEHLAREGAAAKEFPHKSSNGDDCYIEVEFDATELPNLRQDYNKRKITQPSIKGNHTFFKEKVKHPCHLRYRDLQTFVYFKKAERYTYLAKYLGFEKQLQIQDNLFTYKNRLSQRETQLTRIHDDSFSQIQKLILVVDSNSVESEVLRITNDICKKNSLPLIELTNDLSRVEKNLKELIQKDPKTEELTKWGELKRKLKQFREITEFKEKYESTSSLFSELKKNEANIGKLLILNLYKVGLKLLKEGENTCPLCDNVFNGDLKGHVNEKHVELYSLKSQKEDFEKSKKEFISSTKKIITNLDKQLTTCEYDYKFKCLFEIVEFIKSELILIVEKIDKDLSEIQEFPNISDSLINKIGSLNTKVKEVLEEVNNNIQSIEKDVSRQKLADNYGQLTQIILTFKSFLISKDHLRYVSEVKAQFEFVTSSYVEWVKKQIQDSFNLISSNVVEYFKILESNNPNIANPHIKLLSDKDKAVELEIEFASEKINPAFKLLSESQINSFGLAVFLAAIKQFNTDFKFVILDDVVNSFDAYKRPKVIELLNLHFSDF
jgi:hypothetical protein